MATGTAIDVAFKVVDGRPMATGQFASFVLDRSVTVGEHRTERRDGVQRSDICIP